MGTESPEIYHVVVQDGIFLEENIASSLDSTSYRREGAPGILLRAVLSKKQPK